MIHSIQGFIPGAQQAISGTQEAILRTLGALLRNYGSILGTQGALFETWETALETKGAFLGCIWGTISGTSLLKWGFREPKWGLKVP